MRNLLYISLFTTLLFASCISEDIPGEKQNDNNIEIILSVSNFQVSNTTSRSTRATSVGSVAEQEITNLYLFLFDNAGAKAVEKYEVAGATFTTLHLTQVAAGTRDVYVIANYPSTIRTALDAVTTVDALQDVLHNVETPWSTTLGTPILMSGNVNGHNFLTDRQLNAVPLTRAVAKLELNIKLKTERQSTPTIVEGIPGSGNTTSVHQYKYQFIDFDKKTYIYKPALKSNSLMSFAQWVNFTDTDGVAEYKLTGDVVTALTITTYLNERDTYNEENPLSSVELSLPYISGGPLPPPEFGDETYKLPLPTTIERNTWYVYDIEI